MREIYIEKSESLRRVAIKENGRLKECRIEEETNEPVPGEIYKGIIKNIVPGIKSAFVDIGYKKNAYMFLGDELIKTSKNGDEVLVEVIKEELNEKGAKVTPFINIPGRYVVLTNMDSEIKFSYKIDDEEFKSEILSKIRDLVPMGIKLRTKSVGVDIEIIKKEIECLYSKYIDIEKEFKFSLKPHKIYSDSSIVGRIMRDFVSDDTSIITVDNMDDYEDVKRYVDDKYDMNLDLKLYEGHRNLFDYHGIEKDILTLRNSKVNLKCGGTIIIEKTEAMYVIDVNSGRNIKSHNMESTAFTTNREAASEIARQVRLRNLSGIIIVDFIDMKSDEHKDKIVEILQRGFYGDKNKTVIFKPTELNLVQIARKRMGKTIYDYIEEECKMCHGHGKKLRLSYIKLLIRNEVLKKDGDSSVKNIYIEINKLYENDIKEHLFNFMKDIEAIDKSIYLKFSDKVEYFNVEPLIFINQIEALKEYKVCLDNL